MLSNTLQTLRRNLGIFGFATVSLLFLAFLTTLFYLHARNVLELQLRDEIKRTVSAASLSFADLPLDAIQGERDMTTPLYRETVRRLNLARQEANGVTFTYILRPTIDPNTFVFVADADTIDLKPYDQNGDGVIDEKDAPSPPGMPYHISDTDPIHLAVHEPVVDAQPSSDQWGTYISGLAPIVSPKGKFLGVLGMDMRLQNFQLLSESLFPLESLFFVLFACFLFVALIMAVLWKKRVELWRTMDVERKSILALTTHQIGTPVTILRWSLEGLTERKKRKPTKFYLRNIREGIKRLNNILVALHEADDISRDALGYREEQIRLEDILPRLRTRLQERLSFKHQRLQVKLERGLTVRLSRKLLEGVLLEVVGNASDYSPPHSTISLRAQKKNNSVHIDIEDHGCGMSPADLSHVFEKYYRADNAKLMKPDGFGLGLFIVKGITEKAGGKLTIQSTPGKGTTVSIVLPMAR